MKRVMAGTFMAAAFAVGLSAQTPTPQSQPATQDAKDAAKTVTATGCLKAGEQPDSFVLSDVKWKASDKDRTASAAGSSSAVGTSGSTAAPPALAAATTLKLKPSGGTNLTEHVGKQVEVSGTISDKGISATAPDPASARPANAEAALDVRNVKMVAATCSM